MGKGSTRMIRKSKGHQDTAARLKLRREIVEDSLTESSPGMSFSYSHIVVESFIQKR